MELIIKEEPGCVTGVLQGRLDTAAATQFVEDMKPLLAHASEHIQVDCTDLEYISSSGLRAFLTLRKESAAHGGKLTLVGMNDEIKKVFRMTGFLNLFDIKD